MPAPATNAEFLDLIKKSEQVDTGRLESYLNQRRQTDTLPPDPRKLAVLLVREGLMTNFQAEQFLQGKHKGFSLGGYKILERIGIGGTGTVYLAEHEVMRRRVAIKVLPPTFAQTPGVLERFMREARAAAVLDHPNIVHAYDFRHEGQLHFLVMEYVHGPSLQEVLQRQGALPVGAACDYIRQAALGLLHAHEQGMVHRDMKPANLLVDTTGLVKVLDMGLARLSAEGGESLTQKFDDGAVMGTADYIAPEQALSMSDVDHRADIYSLGATLYALLVGEPPFSEGTMAQKLLWHQMREPVPVCRRRPEVPHEVSDIVARMMAKSPADRPLTCATVADSLLPYCPESPVPQAPPRAGSVNAEGASSVRTTGQSTRSANPQPLPGPKTSSHPPRQAEGKTNRLPPPPTEPDAVQETPSSDRKFSNGRVPDIRRRNTDQPPNRSSLVGVLLLVGFSLLVLLLVGGVFAFLFLGQAPKSQVIVDRPPEEKELPNNFQAQIQRGNGEIGLFTDNTAGVAGVAFSPLGNRVASFAQDGVIRIYDPIKKAPEQTLKGHQGSISSLVYSADGNSLLSAGEDRTLRIWNVMNPNAVKIIPAQPQRVRSAVYSRDGKEIISICEDGHIRKFDANNGNPGRAYKTGNTPLTAISTRPQPSHHALLGILDGHVRLWDMGSGKAVRDMNPPHQGVCAGVAFIGDGKRAISIGNEDVRIWDVDPGKLAHKLPGHQRQVLSLVVSPTGKLALTGDVGGTIILWDLRKPPQQAKIQEFKGHSGGISGLAFAPNEFHFVSGSFDRTVRVWGLPDVP